MSLFKSISLWVVAIILMIIIVIYQRTTGPTYPASGSVTVGNTEVKYKLPRSHGGETNAPIVITSEDKTIVGKIKLRRFKSHDEWSEYQMTRDSGDLKAEIPNQPPAGKVMYQISLGKDYASMTELTEEPVIIRFKGAVPDLFLYPHIAMMILAFAFAMRAALEAAFKGKKVLSLSVWTLAFFAFGGLVLGPVIQWYAFGALWTGWPFGHDLTDNKTIASIIIWVIAIWRIRKNPNQTWWAWVATAAMLAVYLVPHSVLGSELDYTKIDAQ